jgi:hypothetical protein
VRETVYAGSLTLTRTPLAPELPAAGAARSAAAAAAAAAGAAAAAVIIWARAAALERDGRRHQPGVPGQPAGRRRGGVGRQHAGGGGAARPARYSEGGKVANFVTVRISGGEVAHGAVSRRSPIPLDTMAARTHMYTCYVGVLDSSIIQGPFPVAPCQTLTLRFATFSSLQAGRRSTCGSPRATPAPPCWLTRSSTSRWRSAAGECAGSTPSPASGEIVPLPVFPYRRVRIQGRGKG